MAQCKYKIVYVPADKCALQLAAYAKLLYDASHWWLEPADQLMGIMWLCQPPWVHAACSSEPLQQWELSSTRDRLVESLMDRLKVRASHAADSARSL